MSSRSFRTLWIAPAFGLFLGLAAEARAQQLVSGGSFTDRTRHDQTLHQGDTQQALTVFYSCVGGDLNALATVTYDIPNSSNVRFVTSGHGPPYSTWDATSPKANGLNGTPSYTNNQHISIPIQNNWSGANFRFFLGNVFLTT